MKRILFLILIVVTAIFAGCESADPETNIELSTQSISFEAEGGNINVVVKSSATWNLQGGADWCTPSAKSGGASTNGTTITFSADKATADRSATFKFVCGDKSVTLTATQKGASADENEEPEPITSNILYTTRSGKILSPSSYGDFGLEIISNVYTEEGGVMTFNGTLTEIVDNAFKFCHDLETITIPEDVTTIGKEAFYECYNLISINLPNSITSIGESVFDGCSSLTTITIPESVTTIGAYSFVGCNTLTEFKGKFASADGRCLIVDGVLNSFAPAGLTEYEIPEGVTEIGKGVFAENREIISITVPEGVTSIGEFAFYACINLTTTNIPESVTTMGDFAFGFSENLKSVNIPEGLTEIALGLFKGCHNITKITIPEGVSLIEEQAFSYCSRLKEVYCKPTIPPTLGGDDAFDQYVSDRIIYVPARDDDSIINAYKSAEYWSAELMMEYDFEINEAIVPYNQIWYSATSKVEPYSNQVFGVTILDNVWNSETGRGIIVLDGNVTTIGEFAFSSCSNLTDIMIPESVTTIDQYAFRDCSNLKTMSIQGRVTSIGYGAFLSCSALSEFKGKLASDDGRCLIIDDVLCMFAPDGLTEYVVPDNVTSIGDGAFRDCSNLLKITIPEGVTSFGDSAFDGCSKLSTINVPESVKSFGGDVFYQCSSLLSITIPEGVAEIGFRAFCDCSSLTTITIPASVTTIGAFAFTNCSSLNSVYCKPTIPPTLDSNSVFGRHASGRKIYVPASDDDSIINAYKVATNWSNYADVIEEYEFD